MSTSTTELSATVSAATREKLVRFAEEFGLDLDFVIEQAVLIFIESAARVAAKLDSRSELPSEAFIPTRFVLDEDTFERVVERIETQPAPTEALRELMRDGDD